LVSAVLPQLQNVHCFSDGASSQYKNSKNILKLCYDEEDFHVAAEQNFFVTSYGKSPCDGNGGTVKWLVVCANPQATEISCISATRKFI
jgi:hypothetical protein